MGDVFGVVVFAVPLEDEFGFVLAEGHGGSLCEDVGYQEFE